MEIHPPHAAAHSLKDFLLQLLTITVGVLVALSIESIVEWRHHRTLVRDAKAMIALEISDNRKELDGELASVTRRNEDIGTALRFADDLLATKQTAIHEVSLGAAMSSLDSASWQSAERTGALSYMEYAEVKAYSSVYALQDLFVAQQRRAMASVTASLSILALGDPHKAQAKDLESFRTHLLAAIADLTAEEQLGRQLLKAYGEIMLGQAHQ
jgi:hypothetical protein